MYYFLVLVIIPVAEIDFCFVLFLRFGMCGSLKGCKIVLGVTGGIAAYKSVYLLRLLVKDGAEVQVIGTENSKNFIGASTWESLSGRAPIYDSFEDREPEKISHIFYAQDVDAVIVAPATANIIGKMANGIADDMLSTVLMAATVPIFITPCMNTEMYNNPAYRRNEESLSQRDNIHFIDPGSGELACRTSGKGRMAEPEEILSFVKKRLFPEEGSGVKWLITGGATREYIDPVRFITNGSSGRTGLAIADAAYSSGGDVTFVGINVDKPEKTKYRFVKTVTAEESARTVLELIPDIDIFVMSAAVADYSPEKSSRKLKKSEGDLTLVLHRTKDILKSTVNSMKEGALRVGFAAETEDLVENARKKLEDKKLDMIVANLVDENNDPFGAVKNTVTVITGNETKTFEDADKCLIGKEIVKGALELWKSRK
jgi:phosphopantothenoylcysteine decarboxylase / phosphopantothenate---cysteine ligase